MSESRGKFVWVDLMAKDVAAATDFYTKVVNWDTEMFGADGPKPYKMFKPRGGSPMGGVMELSEDATKMGAPQHWLGHISTPDCDATAAEAQKLGGKLYYGPEDIPTIGRFAVLADPSGGVFSAFTPLNPMGSDKEPGLGEAVWFELMTHDLEAGFAFYNTLFGWEKTDSMDMGPMGTYQMFGFGGKSIGGIMKCPEGMPMGAWAFYFSVSDLAAAIERATSSGGKLLHGPQDIPGGDHIAMIADPQGGMFALHAKKAA